jgi:hypothetical protein
MTDTIFSLNETQYQKILAAINTQQRGWWPVASIFVSALLAMIVDILLERHRGWRDRIKTTREKQAREIQQINAVISGLVFDIERLFHVASQNILPHYRDVHAVYKRMNADIENDKHVHAIIVSLHKYPSVFIKCPDMYFIEYDFAKELPFVIERDAEMVKHSGWLVAGVREIRDVTSRRDRNIEDAMSVTGLREGAHNLYRFKSVIRMQASIANTECVVASQLFEVVNQAGKEPTSNQRRLQDTGKEIEIYPTGHVVRDNEGTQGNKR